MIKKILLLFALIIASLNINAQQCQNLELTNTVATCAFPITTLEATFLNWGYKTTRSYQVNGPDVCPPQHADPTTANIDVDDQWAPVIFNLGFNFCFYGNTYDQVIVSGNGVVSFDLEVVQDYLVTNPTGNGPHHTWYHESFGELPTQEMQPNAIFGVYCDPDPGEAPVPEDTIKFDLLNQDSPGNRVFVVEYDTPLYESGNQGNDFEQWMHTSIKLYETSNVIDVEVLHKGDRIGTTAQAGKAIIGIQNKSATSGTMAPGRGSTAIWEVLGDPNHGGNVAEQELWRFIPDGDPLNYKFKWFADYGQGNGYEELFPGQLIDDPIIDVNPATQTTYEARLTYETECNPNPNDPNDPNLTPYRESVVIDAPLHDNVTQPIDLESCETTFGLGTANFNLNQFDLILTEYLNSTTTTWDMSNFTITYHATALDRDNNIAITPFDPYTAANNTTIYVRATFNDGTISCFDVYNEFNLKVTPLADATINYSQSIYCTVDSNPIPIVTTSGGTYSINNGGILVSPLTGEIDLVASGLGTNGTGVFDILYETPAPIAGLDCSNSDSTTISIEITEDALFTYPTTACLNDTTNPEPLTFNTGGNFTIVPNTGAIDITTGEINLSSTPAGTYTINYNFNLGGNCPSTDSHNIEILPIDNASFSYPNNTYCNNDSSSTTPTATLPGGAYTINNGGVLVDALTGEINLAASGLGNDSTGVFEIIYTTNGNCPNSSNVNITIEITEDALFTYPTTACLNDTTNPTPLTFNTGGDFTIVPNTGAIDIATGEINLSSTPAGTYTINYNFNLGGNCPSSDSHNIEIYPIDDASFSYPNSNYCNDDTNPTPTATLSGGSYSIDNGGVLVNASTGAINLAASGLGTDGTGNFKITYTTNGNCPNSDDFDVTIILRKDASFDFPTDICSYETNPQAFDVITSGGVYFVDGGASIDSNGVLDLSTTTEGTTYEITYGFNTGLCQSSTSKFITVHITPTATAPTTMITDCNNGDGTANFDISGLESEIIGSQSGITLTYHPTSSDATDNINEINTQPFARVDGNIWARVENTDGCFSIVEIPLTVENCYIVLPQGFSPSSNITENQTFNVRNLKANFPKFKLYIYNRFGNLVYEGDATEENWNGKLNNEGDLLPAGTYFYGIKLNDEQELTNRGWVYLQQ